VEAHLPETQNSPVDHRDPVSAYLHAQLRRLHYPLGLSICSTVITFAFGVCGALAFEKTLLSGSWLGLWQRWDALRFVDLAQHGYHGPGRGEHLIAWLPVYPLAIRLAHVFIPNWHVAAVVFSNLCCAAALCYLFLLAELEYDAGVARRAVLFCAVFPTAYFLHAAYSESIFLLFTVAAFYYGRRGRWLPCALLGMLATGTRIPGLAILPPLALEYLQQRNFHWRKIRWDAATFTLMPLGAIFYLLINYGYFGDPLHFLVAQREHWDSFIRWPTAMIRDNWYGVNHAKADERLLQYGGPLVAFVFTTAAVFAGIFIIRPCYSLYAALSWVIIFFNNFPISSPRYVLSVFPIYLLLGRIAARDWLRDSIAFLFALFYATCAMHFASGWWAF
jgi:Gpi18-like mannosyltransferase